MFGNIKKINALLAVCAFAGMSSIASAHQEIKHHNVAFEAVGQCGDYVVSNEPAGVIVAVTQDSSKHYLVSHGPSDDGSNGCSLFKAITECTSNVGSFLVEKDNGRGPFHAPATVTQFSCAN